MINIPDICYELIDDNKMVFKEVLASDDISDGTVCEISQLCPNVSLIDYCTLLLIILILCSKSMREIMILHIVMYSAQRNQPFISSDIQLWREVRLGDAMHK